MTKPIISPSSMMRVWGKVYHYFNVTNPHGWEGLSYAHGRKWRVVQTIDNGEHTTYKCEPIHVKRRLGWEFETKEEDD